MSITVVREGSEERRILDLEAEVSRLQSIADHNAAQCIALEAERDKLREAIRRSIRLLSFGGDAEVMAILEQTLDAKNPSEAGSDAPDNGAGCGTIQKCSGSSCD